MFRTEISPALSKISLDHSKSIVSMGSCFANVIGQKLAKNKFPVLTNPFGIIFNPVSIFHILNCTINGTNLSGESYFQNNGLWFNFHLHSNLAAGSNIELEDLIKIKLSATKDFIAKTDLLILTFGTSVVYRFNKTNEVIANCHKADSALFTKDLLSPKDILKEFEALFANLKVLNADLKIILTVSPVRHLKDTLELNSVSKSIVRMSCHEMTKISPDIEYFPSYEIMMDDLRDYRFYKEDMIHPTEVAENYVWEKFINSHTNESTNSIIKEWDSLKKAINHKPFHEGSEGYQVFLKETIKKLILMNNHINLDEEIKDLQRKLK